MDKPDVDFIEGLSPAISIDQKNRSRQPALDRGHDHRDSRLPRLLFAPRSASSTVRTAGKVVTRQTPQQIVDQVLARTKDERFLVLATVVEGSKGGVQHRCSQNSRPGFLARRASTAW